MEQVRQQFTPGAARAVGFALEEARLRGSRSVGPEHLLLGLLRERQGAAALALAAVGVSQARVRASLPAPPKATSPKARSHMPSKPLPAALSTAAKHALRIAVQEAQSYRDLEGQTGRIDTEHLLLGLLHGRSSPTSRLLRDLGADLVRLRTQILARAVGLGAPAPKDPPQIISADRSATWRRFSSVAMLSLVEAERAARWRGSSIVGSDHLLLALAEQANGVAAKALRESGVDLARLQEVVGTSSPDHALPADQPMNLAPGTRQVLELALKEAQALNPKLNLPDWVGTAHLLLGLLCERDGQALRLLKAVGVQPARLRQRVIAHLTGIAGTTTADQEVEPEMPKPQPFTTTKLPVPKAPYSQAVRCGEFLFVSGMGPVDPHTGAVIKRGFERQVTQTLDNLKTLLEAAGTSLSNVVKTTIYVTDLDKFPQLNEIYARYFPKAPPARTTIEASRLPFGIPVEIDAIAYLPKGKK